MDRKRYIENNDFETALESYLSNFERIGDEVVPSSEGLGRITSKAVYADFCDPVYNAAAMDGIEVLAESTLGATEKTPVTLREGVDFNYINTGGAISDGFDAVIMIEDVLQKEDGIVEIITPAHQMQHVRVVGESVSACEMLLPSSHRIRPEDMGCIVSATKGEILVSKTPKVALIPTGGEMIDDTAKLKKGKLMESNSHVFAALTKTYGGEPIRFPVVPDDEKLLEEAVKKAVKECDVVVINAGSSAGTKDYTVHIIEKLGKVRLHGLAIKPGKPTILGEIDGKPVVGVPGYPVSAYIVFTLVVKPLLAKLTGEKCPAPEKVKAILTRRTTSSFKAKEFVRVALGEVGGKLVATPLDRGAAAVMSFVKADGLLEIPRLVEGIEKDTEVEVTLLKPLSQIKDRLVFIGSHDMLVDVIANHLPASSSHTGSMGGISALLSGSCHVAPIHLLDTETGEYNLSYVKKYFKGEKMALIKCVKRIQGFLTRQGEEVHSLREVAEKGLRFANRQSGAGTRLLVDYNLKTNNIPSSKIVGYDKELNTHLAVAAGIAGGAFDTGVAVLSACKAFGLSFTPLAEESYDFLVRYDSLKDKKIQDLIAFLKSDDFKNELDSFGGYDHTLAGEIEVIEC